MAFATEELQKWFPSATAPFICNAPMYGSTNATLATAVVKSGGFGFIGGGVDFAPGAPTIPSLSSQLSEARTLLNLTDPTSVLPLGIGFLTLKPANFIPSVEPLLLEHRPAAVWLFCPSNPKDHTEIIKPLKAIGAPWNLRVFVQVGSVLAAREAAGDGADVIVAQGIDAGGHQWAQGASVMTMVPEVRDMLAADFADRTIPVLAAGGITDGRGIAAALALGASGTVMGTRFLVTEEAPASGAAKDAILETVDGGATTVKSTVHDDIQGTAFWPEIYDGRAIIGKSYRDHVGGMSKEENIGLFKKAAEEGDSSRRTVWAGTGVGLIKKMESAGDVVTNTQAQAKHVLAGLGKL